MAQPTEKQIKRAKKIHRRLIKNPQKEWEIKENIMTIARALKAEFTSGWFEGLCAKPKLISEEKILDGAQ